MTTFMWQADEDACRETGMPGWDIVGDLTPPELVDQRSLAVLRRRVVAGLVALLALCACGYAYTTALTRSAGDDAAAVRQQSVQLNRTVQEYSGITRIENTVRSIGAQQSSLLATDVDVPQALASVRKALPGSMSIQSVSVSVTGGTTGSTQLAGSGSSSTGLDASGHSVIGTVTITGSGGSLDDLPSFVDRLSRVHGFVDVLPTSNQLDGNTSQFSVTMALTDVLYINDHDATAGAQ